MYISVIHVIDESEAYGWIKRACQLVEETDDLMHCVVSTLYSLNDVARGNIIDDICKYASLLDDKQRQMIHSMAKMPRMVQDTVDDDKKLIESGIDRVRRLRQILENA